MIQTLETDLRRPDTIVIPEKPRIITGLAALIIDVHTSEIRVIRERRDKPSTGRKAGELSVPIETRKVGEDPEGNLYGALPEAFDRYDIHGRDIRRILERSLYHMEGNTYHPGFKQKLGDKIIHCEYAVVLYDGPNIEVEPFNSKEVGDAQWVPMDRLLQSDVRSLAGHAVWHALSNGIIQENLRRYHQEPRSRLRLLPPGFSIPDIYHDRELLVDVGK